MKTLINTLSLVLVLTFTSTINTFASNELVAFEDETYINDIPFNTEVVANEALNISFAEEEYINDIPFDTESIAVQVNYEKASKVKFEIGGEALINDIPFNTKLIAMTYYYELAMSQAFEFSEENEVNDIPFDTYQIAYMADSTFVNITYNN